MAQPISNLAVGSKIRFGKHQVMSETPEQIVWTIADKNHAGYPANSVTLVTSQIIDFRAFDAMEPANPNSDRKNYGNNRYLHSNMRQWLNKSGAGWYVAQHGQDQAPDNTNTGGYNTPYDTRAGFLTHFTQKEKDALLATTLTVVKNTVIDGGGSETVSDKIFLLSTTEVGLANENSIAEGTKLALFSDNTSRLANATVQAFNNSANTNKPGSQTTNWYYWLRTPNSGNSHYVRYVNSGGTLNYNSARHGSWGLRCACNLASSLLVSNTATGGVYDVVWNEPPTVTVTGGNSLGNKYQSFSITYKVNDAEGDAVNMVLKLDNTVKENVNNVPLNANRTFNVDATTFKTLSAGAHTISITVNDNIGGETVTNVTFTRVSSAPVISTGTTALGNKWLPFNFSFSINDDNPEDTLSYSVNIDGTMVLGTNNNVIRNQNYTINITQANLDALSIGAHTINVVANDGVLAAVTKSISFTKQYDKIAFKSAIIETDLAAANIVVNMMYKGSTTTPVVVIEACNNAYDTNPTWETMTPEFLEKTPHTFTNKSKTNSKWGVQVRVQVIKNAIPTVEVSAIGFSFN